MGEIGRDLGFKTACHDQTVYSSDCWMRNCSDANSRSMLEMSVWGVCGPLRLDEVGGPGPGL